MTKELLGTFIAQQRRALELTQKDLAERLHVTDKAVSKWERGLSYPDVTLLEPLAEELGLEVGELLACREKREEEPMRVLMDISKENLRAEKRRGSRRLVGVLILMALTALLAVYVLLIGRVNNERNTIFWTECIGEENYIYLEKEEHLLKLKCGDEDIQAIKEDEKNPYFGRRIYYIDYTWNKRTYEGTLHVLEKSDLISLGGIDDGEVDDTVSTNVFGEYGYLFGSENYYRNPYGEGYLCDYRIWYYTDDKRDPLLLIKDCLSAAVMDIDADGENEVVARTYYVERPYVIYDNTTGTIEPTYVADIPEECKEPLICIWER